MWERKKTGFPEIQAISLSPGDGEDGLVYGNKAFDCLVLLLYL